MDNTLTPNPMYAANQSSDPDYLEIAFEQYMAACNTTMTSEHNLLEPSLLPPKAQSFGSPFRQPPTHLLDHKERTAIAYADDTCLTDPSTDFIPFDQATPDIPSTISSTLTGLPSSSSSSSSSDLAFQHQQISRTCSLDNVLGNLSDFTDSCTPMNRYSSMHSSCSLEEPSASTAFGWHLQQQQQHQHRSLDGSCAQPCAAAAAADITSHISADMCHPPYNCSGCDQSMLQCQQHQQHGLLLQRQVPAVTPAAAASVGTPPANCSSSTSSYKLYLVLPLTAVTQQPQQLPSNTPPPSAAAAAAPSPAPNSSSSSLTPYTQQDKDTFYSWVHGVLSNAQVSVHSLTLPGRERWMEGKRRGPQEYYRVIARGVAELFAIEAFTLAIYTADKAGNLTQGICDSIMEQVIGGSYPRPGKIAGPRALLHPQADEMSEHGVVLYLTRLLSYGTGYLISPLQLLSWFKPQGNGYELDYDKMTAELGPCGRTRSWSLPLNLDHIKSITAAVPTRVIVKPPREKKGQGRKGKGKAAAASKAKGGVQKPKPKRC